MAEDGQDRWRRIDALFAEALDRPAEERTAFLDAACEDDPELRREVKDLLDAHEAAEGFLVDPLARLGVPPPPGIDLGETLTEQAAVDEAGEAATRQGQRISHYIILEKFGGGGMGVVYRARDLKLKRTVALKFLPPHLSWHEEARERFVREAQAASALNHDNICTIHEIDETDDGRLFISMAYYEGETLKKKIARGPLPLDEALGYAVQMAEGLERAHEAGIIHRDIKPANVMVTSRGRVKILDFGLAKLAGAVDLTRTGVMMGTRAYMSPEQTRGERVDHRTDIWSFGVMLYEMLTGERPFNSDYELAIIYAVLNEDPHPLTQVKADLPPDLEPIVNRCLEKDKNLRYQAASDVEADLETVRRQRLSEGFTGRGTVVKPTGLSPPALSESTVTMTAPGDGSDPVRRCTLFLSYTRDVDPDQALAMELYSALGRHHDVFIDQATPAGTHWVEHVETALRDADFLIILLSEHSVHSEMVVGELEMAYRLAKEQDTLPNILPVRVAYHDPFTYPLSLYLNDINWAYWDKAQDTPRLIAQLMKAIAGGGLPVDAQPRGPVFLKAKREAFPSPLVAAQPPPRLELPEGTMDPQSAFYVERPVDATALQAVKQQGVTITIKGPRQMGKSSLLMRTMATAAQAGKHVVYLDFQLFGQSALDDADTFFRQFCAWLTDELELEDRVDAFWRNPLGNSQRCTRYVGRYLLKELGTPLVVAMDEVERVFGTAFRSDFFSMLRSWHNDRAIKPRWKQLDLVLVTSTAPYQLIENLNQSPFNVGEIIDLTDFLPDQVADLNHRHGTPLSAAEVEHLQALLGGHPYLTRRALYLVASRRISMKDLLATATKDRGPFDDHLRYHLFRLHGHDDLLDGLHQVIHQRACRNETIFWRLRGAGLVRREGRAIVPRCKLYADYFRRRLNG